LDISNDTRNDTYLLEHWEIEYNMFNNNNRTNTSYFKDLILLARSVCVYSRYLQSFDLYKTKIKNNKLAGYEIRFDFGNTDIQLDQNNYTTYGFRAVQTSEGEVKVKVSYFICRIKDSLEPIHLELEIKDDNYPINIPPNNLSFSPSKSPYESFKFNLTSPDISKDPAFIDYDKSKLDYSGKNIFNDSKDLLDELDITSSISQMELINSTPSITSFKELPIIVHEEITFNDKEDDDSQNMDEDFIDLKNYNSIFNSNNGIENFIESCQNAPIPNGISSEKIVMVHYLQELVEVIKSL